MRALVLAVVLVVCAAASAQAQFNVVHAFGPSMPQDAFNPNGLRQGSDGNFYATSQSGGTTFQGTVFRMTPSGTVTVLHNFSGSPDGAFPVSDLIQARDGNFYGTTTEGGATNHGMVFRITPGGTLTTVHDFAVTDGATPYGLIEGTDGNLYGTTTGGGDHGAGVIYRVSTTSSNFAVLHSFAGFPTDAFGVRAALVEGFDGNFYGTAPAGGAGNIGAVYKMTPAGTVSLLHSFAGGPMDGAAPMAPLVQAIDGNFYGTTFNGGPGALGTVFKMTPAGAVTILHSFTGVNEGAHPASALMKTSDLMFYGTTQFGPTAPAANGPGTLFSMTFAGAVSTIHVFSIDGQNPMAAMVHGQDGNFYGTVGAFGPNGFGTAFRYVNPATCDDFLTLSYAAGALRLGFTLETTTPATWSTYLFTSGGSAKLWSLAIPAIAPAVSFDIPLAGFPAIGNIFVLTALVPASGPVCADLQTVNTGP